MTRHHWAVHHADDLLRQVIGMITKTIFIM
jgi:hypothetical protein